MIVGDEPCPQCRAAGGDKTGDHLMVFDDGGKHCNRCGYHVHPGGERVQEEEDMAADPKDLEAADIPKRGLKKTFVEMYGGKVEYNTTTREPSAIWWPRYKKGIQSGWKIASLTEKTFRAVGDGKDCDLFGMEIEGGTKLCIVTEGEADAVAASQMIAEAGKTYRVVSLPYGAKGKMNAFSQEFLASFETIIIATDMDKPGDEAAEALAGMFDAGKCKRAMLPAKDANDALLEGKGKAFFSALMSARTVMADGVVLGVDTWDAILKDHHTEHTGGIPFPWQGLNDMAYGSRLGELDVWTSGTGMGKSATMRELIHHWSIMHGQKVGVLALEESLTDTILGQMSICANLPLHLPEVRASVSDEDLRKYWEMANANSNLVCLDHWGSVEESRLIQKIRYLASGMGCKYIPVDHLSILVSETAADGDERKNIDVLMTKLKRLTEELQIHISLVSHLNSAPGATSFEEGAVPNLGNLRGSRSIGQLAHGVYALSRNQQDPDPFRRNLTQITVLKNRFCGRTGPAQLLQYDAETGRLNAAEMSIEDYNNGQKSTNPLDTGAA